MDSFKTWLVEVGWKKIAPSLIKGALAALVGLIAAHQGILAHMGITYDPVGHTIDLDLDTLSGYVMVAGGGLLTALLTAMQHHAVAAVTGAPQDGDMRTATGIQVRLVGQRKDDPK
jgi:hypothetical protein